MRQLPAGMAGMRRWFIAACACATGALAHAEWPLVEAAPLTIGDMAEPVVAVDPLRVVILVPVDASRDQNAPRFMLVEASDDGTQSRPISGIDAGRYEDAFLRQLVEWKGAHWLVLAGSGMAEVYRIDGGSAELAGTIESSDELFHRALIAGDRLVLLSHAAIHVADAADPTRWRKLPFDGLTLLDGRPGQGDCLLDALMRADTGWGMYCVDADADSVVLSMSLEGYGLQRTDMPVLLGDTRGAFAVLARADQGQIALLCDTSARKCGVAPMSETAYPGLTQRRAVAAVPRTTTAVSVRLASGDAELRAHDLVSGMAARLTTRTGIQPEAEGQGWGGIFQAAVVDVGDAAVVLLFNYTEAIVTRDTGVTVEHGLSVRPVVVTAADVAAALGQP